MMKTFLLFLSALAGYAAATGTPSKEQMLENIVENTWSVEGTIVLVFKDDKRYAPTDLSVKFETKDSGEISAWSTLGSLEFDGESATFVAVGIPRESALQQARVCLIKAAPSLLEIERVIVACSDFFEINPKPPAYVKEFKLLPESSPLIPLSKEPDGTWKLLNKASGRIIRMTTPDLFPTHDYGAVMSIEVNLKRNRIKLGSNVLLSGSLLPDLAAADEVMVSDLEIISVTRSTVSVVDGAEIFQSPLGVFQVIVPITTSGNIKLCLKQKSKPLSHASPLFNTLLGCTLVFPVALEKVVVPAVITSSYRALTLIASGAFGDIWKCFHAESKSLRAIKVPRTAVERSLRAIKDPRRAGSTALAREIAFIQKVTEDGQRPGHVLPILEDLHGAIAMPLMETDLLEMASRILRGPDVKLIGRNILKGLQQIHEKGIIHSDIKPENIMLPSKTSRDAFIIDFGLSCNADFKTFCASGTVAYLHPSYIFKLPSTTKEDVFAFAVTMTLLITRTYMFSGMIIDLNAACDKQLLKVFMALGKPTPDFLGKLHSSYGTKLKNSWNKALNASRVSALNASREPASSASPDSALNASVEPASNASWEPSWVTLIPAEAFDSILERTRFIAMVNRCLKWDTEKIPTAQQLLMDPFFL